MGCTPQETACIRTVVNIALRSLKTLKCFDKIVKGNKCSSDQLTQCLIDGLSKLSVTCSDMGPLGVCAGPCYVVVGNGGNVSYSAAKNEDKFCVGLKSSGPRCDPCELPFPFAYAEDCSLCDGTKVIPVTLCRTPVPYPDRWPVDKRFEKPSIDKVYCNTPGNKERLASLIVH